MMSKLDKFLSKKVSKKTFVIAVILLLTQFILAHNSIIKPISMRPDTTLFYTIVYGCVITFPFIISVILAYLLDRVKWLDKPSFLKVFIFISAFCTSATFLSESLNDFIGIFFEKVLEYTLAPLAYVTLAQYWLGYIAETVLSVLSIRSWGGFFLIVVILGIFFASLILSVIYSRLTLLSKRGKKIYKKIFLILFRIYLLIAIALSVHHVYVRHLIKNDQCVYGLKAWECDDVQYIDEDYFTYDNNIYYRQLSKQLPEADIETFQVLGTDGFSKDKNKAYHYENPILVNDINSWEMIDNDEYYSYTNRHSRDDQSLFYYSQKLESSHPDTTFVFDRDYACNDQYVYLYGEKIEGADPDTFVTLGCGGTTKDKNGYYLYGKRNNSPFGSNTTHSCLFEVHGSCKEVREKHLNN